MTSSMMYSLASRVLAIASSMIGLVSPWILISIWIAVIPFCCTCYLEVHISKEILQTLDICQNEYNHHRSHRLPDHRKYLLLQLLDRYTGCHQGHAGCTDTCLRSRTVGFKGLGYGTDRIWELFLTWQYRNQSSLCQCAMTDLTTSRSSGRLCLTYRVAREVIMMHITSWILRSHPVHPDLLCFGQRSQCADVADLCLSSGEHGRTMYSRDQYPLLLPADGSV